MTNKQLHQFFQGLTVIGDDLKLFVDNVWLDIFPQTTREIDMWEDQFGIGKLSTPYTEQERRDRLDATWSATGGQSPRYIQDTLQANGFDVYIHEWWDPNYWPLYAFYCGDVVAECGESGVECANANIITRNPFDVLAPDNLVPVVGKGYPLVNKIPEITPDLIAVCGEAVAECGEVDASCYNYESFTYRETKAYYTTTDPLTWPYYLYIGGEVFGDIVQIPAERQNEFENLCLKICPTQQWLGMLVEYV